MKRRIQKKLDRDARRHARQTLRVVVHHVRPEPGDFVVLQLPETVPMKQLQAFRRQFYETQTAKGIQGAFVILSCGEVQDAPVLQPGRAGRARNRSRGACPRCAPG